MRLVEDPAPGSRRWQRGLLVLAVVAAYANSFRGAFVLDDEKAILGNPSLRGLASALFPPHGEGLTVEGRPLVNVSLALNHALSGTALWSYHAVNLLIHVLATLALYGLLRRTLARGAAPGVAPPAWRAPAWLEPHAPAVAFLAALLWALHPLQTESVTYIVQRTESLMGLFYFTTLYAFVRAADGGCRAGSLIPAFLDLRRDRRSRPTPVAGDRSSIWYVVSLLACLAGMATKEVMVTAPLVVWLYDRTFVAGSFAAASRRRRGYYLALAATWLLLALLVIGAGDRGGTIGARAGVAWWQYALTQARGLVHYVHLGVWPVPLIFDYGSDFVTWSQALPFAVVDAAVLAATAWALARRPALGFLGAWFFLILAPTTSVVGGTRQMLAEHRLYLSLAAVSTLAVVVVVQALGRRAWAVLAALAVLLGALTVRRNEDYRSERTLYRDTAMKRPGNVHARYNLGNLLAEAGEWDAAIREDRAAIALAPGMAAAHYNLANALDSAGRAADAVAEYQAALRLDPRYMKAHYNLGTVLLELGRKSEAADEFRAAATLAPDFVEARDNLGGVLLDLGRLEEARAEFLAVLQLKPDSLETHCNLGAVYFLQGHRAEAVAEYERALAIDPHFAPALQGLARTRGPSAR